MIDNILIGNRTAAQQKAEWGFTYAEIEKLGLVATDKCHESFNIDILNFSFKDLKYFYRDIINNPSKYKSFASWLKPRFDKFIELKTPIRIYIGNGKFLNRGDAVLEKSLKNISSSINKYIREECISPEKISAIIYYLNKIV